MSVFKKLGLATERPGAYSGFSFVSTTKDQGFIDSINPTTEKSIGTVRNASLEDYETVMCRAQAAHLNWREIPAPKRGEIIREIGERLREKKDILGSLVSCETGKSKQEGDGEVQEMIDIADFAVGQSRMMYGVTMPSERESHRLYEQWHPLGCVAVITAFNFPVAVWAWNAFLAAVGGNVVVWKPSPKAPLSAIAVHEICCEVLKKHNIDGIFSLVISDKNRLVDKICDDPRFPLVSFTGSTAIGRLVSERVAKRLGRCLLELSGNNAIIVDETANLSLAIPAIAFGAVGTAGQRCTTTRRVFAHRSLYEKLKASLMHAYQQVTVGDPLDEKHLMGPLIDESAVQSFLKTIASLRSSGVEIVVGGNRIERTGFFVEPTLVCVESYLDIMQEETFGPLLYLMPYDTIEEAIALQNRARHGLSSAIFSTNIHHIELFLSHQGSDCGIANVNMGTSGAEIGGAFGGEKETGGGRESGSDAWKGYMRRQTVGINWGKGLPLAQGIRFDIASEEETS